MVGGSEASLGIVLEHPGIEINRTSRTVALVPHPTPVTQGDKQEQPAVSFVGSGNYATSVLMPAFKDTGARLRSVASSGGVSGVHAGRKFGFEETTTDTDRLFADPSTNAVVIATRHDSHARWLLKALAAGKHVFVEKPMAKTIHEVRFLKELAEKKGLVTQMGNQGHNIEGTMATVEWIQSGAIGNVHEVHMWSNRPVWAQGPLERPAGMDVPKNLNYDVWLGPAPEKPYNPDTTHFAWRGLWDYGTGAMGDMGAHTFDAPIWALDLGMPTKIQATTSPYTEEYLPQSENVMYEFPARGDKPAVKVTWSDGGIKPFRRSELEADRNLREALYIGDKGMLMHGTHGAMPELIPEDPGFVAPEKWLNRPSSVYVDFIEAIKEGRKAANDFEIASKLTEIMLLTNIAVAAQKVNRTLEYDAENMKITNCEEANDYFHYKYREGWKL